MQDLKTVFDQEQALVGVDSDRELLAELVDIFLEDCDRMVDELRGGVEAASAERVERAAHTLKGSVSVLAANEVQELAAELERRGREGDIADAGAQFALVDGAVGRLKEALREFLAG